MRTLWNFNHEIRKRAFYAWFGKLFDPMIEMKNPIVFAQKWICGYRILNRVSVTWHWNEIAREILKCSISDLSVRLTYSAYFQANNASMVLIFTDTCDPIEPSRTQPKNSFFRVLGFQFTWRNASTTIQTHLVIITALSSDWFCFSFFTFHGDLAWIVSMTLLNCLQMIQSNFHRINSSAVYTQFSNDNVLNASTMHTNES